MKEKRIGRPNRIDLKKLSNMRRQGVSPTKCAEFFGVTPSAVTQACKKLNFAVAKNVTMETGATVVAEGLDSMANLRKINNETNKLIDLLSAWVAGDPKAIRKLERQHRLLRIGAKKGTNAASVKDPKEVLLKAIQEVRSQVKLSLDIMESLYNMKQIAEFQKIVIETIGDASPETRAKIIKLLQQRRNLRGSITM